MPTYPEIFRVSRALQCANTELSIFSRELGETVSIAYPINRVTGDRIVARQLKDWVLRRKVIWECFCALVTEQRTPVHFETNHWGHSMAYCHQSPSHCGFSLNLSEARETALLESRYTHVLTRVYHNHHQLMDLHGLVLRVHHNRVAATPNGHAELFPYFEDYCGTPTSSALIQPRRGGAVRTRRQFSAAHNISLQHQIHRPSAPLRLPSVADDTHIELASPTSSTEQGDMQILMRNELRQKLRKKTVAIGSGESQDLGLIPIKLRRNCSSLHRRLQDALPADARVKIHAGFQPVADEPAPGGVKADSGRDLIITAYEASSESPLYTLLQATCFDQ
ncbi:hypothetical protein C8R48DRAFT_776964 [Suillus tomentosus]|nr:hypothetical protein C8R48DRAFT_776964 [Suillus tomentosus]